YPVLPVHLVAIDRVARRLAVDLEERETLRARTAAPLRRIAKRSQFPPVARADEHSRPLAGKPLPQRRKLLLRLVRLDDPDHSLAFVRRDVLDVLLGYVHLARVGGRPVAETSVDRLLRGPESRDRLGSFVYVVEVRAQHHPQDTASAMR